MHFKQGFFSLKEICEKRVSFTYLFQTHVSFTYMCIFHTCASFTCVSFTYLFQICVFSTCSDSCIFHCFRLIHLVSDMCIFHTCASFTHVFQTRHMCFRLVYLSLVQARVFFTVSDSCIFHIHVYLSHISFRLVYMYLQVSERDK